MRRLMPNKIKTPMRIYKNITGMDLITMAIWLMLSVLTILIKMPIAAKIAIIAVVFSICFLLCSTFNSVKGRVLLRYAFIYMFVKKQHKAIDIKNELNVRCKEYMKYNGFAATIIEIEGIDFFGLNDHPDNDEQSNKIDILTELFKNITCGKIIKYEKDIDYTIYIENCQARIVQVEELIADWYADPTNSNIQNPEADKILKALMAQQKILINQKSQLEEQQLFGNNKTEAFALIIFENDEEEQLIELERKTEVALNIIEQVGMTGQRLEGKEIKKFLNLYFVDIALEQTLELQDVEEGTEGVAPYHVGAVKEGVISYKYGDNDIEYGIISICKYNVFTDNGWGVDLFTIPNTKVVFNFSTYETKDLEKEFDKTIGELWSVASDKRQSERMKNDCADRAVALENVKNKCKYEGDTLFDTQFFILFRKEDRKLIMRTVLGSRHKADACAFHQYNSYSETWPFLPMRKIHLESVCQMPASQCAAMFPFVNYSLRDKNGLYIGYTQTPVFFDIFNRTEDRRSSNTMILGKLGSGKSYLLKLCLMNWFCYGTKLFVFDPENEFAYLAKFFGGEVINVAGLSNGIINPLQVPYPLPEEDDVAVKGEVTAHKQFLDNFFKVVLPEMNVICHQFLAILITELYNKWNIYDGIDLDKFAAKDFPTMADLITLAKEKEEKADHDYDKEHYHILNIFLKKFDTNGSYCRLWNGKTSFSIKDTNFITFSFRELFASTNKSVANGQMMLLVMFVNQLIIKNRETNLRNKNTKSKFVVVFDECHNFIDPTFPVALDFMARMSKQCRKYQGAQITATQNINDMVATSLEIRAKTTALLNNAAYSFLFGLSVEDIAKVKEIYSAGDNPLKASEVQYISSATKGKALLVVSKQSRIKLQIATYAGDEQYFIQQAERE